MLTIEPHGGICNRLFALHSAHCLARDTGQDLRVLWNISPDLGAKFEDLFTVPSVVDRLISIVRFPPSDLAKVRQKLRLLSIWPPLRRDFGWREVIQMQLDGVDFPAIARRKNAHIEAVSLFYAGREPFFPFQPSEPLAKRIDEEAKGFEDLVGVHIRRTDNVKSKEQSPTERFIEEMQKILAETPSQRFFLATDDPAEIGQLKDAFPDRIETRPVKSVDRSDRAALEDAVVDLYCLARTKKVLGSGNSTFSVVGAMLGGHEPVVVTTAAEQTDKKWWLRE
ncbi:MAG: hypothetical protein AAFV31_19030 [Pseudomonadota bacterium]